MHILYNLVGFNEFFDYENVLLEANKKFGNTYLILNNNLVSVAEFRDYHIQTTDGSSYPYSKIHTLKPWFPKTGIYKYLSTFIYLKRTSKRQWLKSFSLFNNYDFLNITDKPLIKLDPHLIFEEEKQPSQFISDCKQWLKHNNQIVFRYHVVATINEDEILVTDKRFYQEVLDTWKEQYAVNLVLKFQNQVLEKS